MTLINRIHLSTRRSILPPQLLGSVVLYRVNAKDEIVATQRVNGVEIDRGDGDDRSESPTLDGPMRKRSKKFHLWTDQLRGWRLQENDIIFHDGAWWHIYSVDNRMIDTRHDVLCNESSDPR